VDIVRYRPGEAIRWLETGAQEVRNTAKRQGKSLVRREGERSIGKDIRDAAGVLVNMGKSALAEIKHRQATASEYVLHDDRLEIISPGKVRTISYDSVRSIKQRGDRATLILDQGSESIKPHAYIVSGRLRVPIGWSRNGLEVPFEVLLDELSARCDVEIEYVA
jgi:hypothetical protein